MKYTRFKSGNNINWGEIIGNEIVELSDNYINPDSSKTNTSHSLSDVELISPVTPGKVVAIGLNYKSHLGDKPAPAVPEPFYKLPDTIIGSGENIVIPKVTANTSYDFYIQAIVLYKKHKFCTEIVIFVQKS